MDKRETFAEATKRRDAKRRTKLVRMLLDEARRADERGEIFMSDTLQQCATVLASNVAKSRGVGFYDVIREATR